MYYSMVGARRYSLGLSVHLRALCSRWLAPTLSPGLRDYPLLLQRQRPELFASIVTKESLPLFTRMSRETVWKIARGLLSVRVWWHPRRQNRDSGSVSTTRGTPE